MLTPDLQEAPLCGCPPGDATPLPQLEAFALYVLHTDIDALWKYCSFLTRATQIHRDSGGHLIVTETDDKCLWRRVDHEAAVLRERWQSSLSPDLTPQLGPKPRGPRPSSAAPSHSSAAGRDPILAGAPRAGSRGLEAVATVAQDTDCLGGED